ncbi:hypothetical protein TNCV_2377521 [Trichonephila clavipes]|nr:hypothetical protein TNCV_2377521 [Trichonephila clavipes]
MRMHVKPVSIQSPSIDVLWYFGEGVQVQVSSLSLDYGSRLRDGLHGPAPFDPRTGIGPWTGVADHCGGLPLRLNLC